MRSADASAPLVVSGDGEGLVDLATIGALDGSGVVLYAATFADDPARLQAEIAQPRLGAGRHRLEPQAGAALDRPSRHHGRDRAASTRRALTKDENDNRLDVFPDAGTDAQTVVQTPGVAVSTSRYGDPGFYQPEYRGARAFDGDTDTQWEVGAHAKVIGEQLRLDLDQPITTDQVNLVQPLVGPTQRYLTQVELSFDGGAPITVDLDRRVAHRPTGRPSPFPSRTFHQLDITHRRHQRGRRVVAAVLEQRRLRRDPAARTTRPASRTCAPTRSCACRPTWSTPRATHGRRPSARLPDEPVPHGRGPAALLAGRGGAGAPVPGARRPLVRDPRAPPGSPLTRPDDVLDRVLGIPGAAPGGITVTVVAAPPGRHPGAWVVGVRRRSRDRVDHRVRRAGGAVGRRGDARSRSPSTTSTCRSSPTGSTRCRRSCGSTPAASRAPSTCPRSPTPRWAAARSTVPVQFAPLTGSDVRITVTGTRPVDTLDYHERVPTAMPVAIAEVGSARACNGHRCRRRCPPCCRIGILSVDGQEVGRHAQRFDGRRRRRSVRSTSQLCSVARRRRRGHSTAGTTCCAPGGARETGVDVDGLVLGSDAGGAPMTLGERGEAADRR